jgi:hypothetical protein
MTFFDPDYFSGSVCSFFYVEKDQIPFRQFVKNCKNCFVGTLFSGIRTPFTQRTETHQKLNFFTREEVEVKREEMVATLLDRLK